MNRALYNQAKRIGLSPGSQRVTNDANKYISELSLTKYDQKTCEQLTLENSETIATLSTGSYAFNSSEQVNWLNISGLSDSKSIDSLKTLLNLHSLTLEDINVLGQRPKLEVFDNYLFVTLHRCELVDESLEMEQISLLLKDDTVVSLQEHEGNSFSAILDRITKKRGRIRQQDSDYLFYCLIDAVIDQHFVVLEMLQNTIDELEVSIVNQKTVGLLEKINIQRQNLLWLRQNLRPFQTILSELMEEESFRLSSEDKPFLQDGLDHVRQCLDSIDAMREMLGDLNELYASYGSLRLNELVKFLTIMSSIFIPLSFITGLFGMNFISMPAIQHVQGFLWTVLAMLAVVISMILYFWYKKWF